MKKTPQTLLTALLLAALPGLALAQTATPAKPAAKTAAKPAAAPAKAASAPDKTMSLGGKSGSGPILTRDELRVCLSQEESLRKRLDAHTALRAPLDKEKAELSAEGAALAADTGPVTELNKQAEAVSAKAKEYSARITAHQDKISQFNTAAPTGISGERQRVALTKERESIDAEGKVLETERVAFEQRRQQLIADMKEKAAKVETKRVDWNQRNEEWNQGLRALEADRTEWVFNCADRRYREDDEIAIKRGK